VLEIDTVDPKKRLKFLAHFQRILNSYTRFETHKHNNREYGSIRPLQGRDLELKLFYYQSPTKWSFSFYEELIQDLIAKKDKPNEGKMNEQMFIKSPASLLLEMSFMFGEESVAQKRAQQSHRAFLF